MLLILILEMYLWNDWLCDKKNQHFQGTFTAISAYQVKPEVWLKIQKKVIKWWKFQFQLSVICYFE